MTLNKLPDGTDAPKYEVTAVSFSGEEKTITLTEWWYEGRKVESIEDSAQSAFYDAFDKESFMVVSIVRI